MIREIREIEQGGIGMGMNGMLHMEVYNEGSIIFGRQFC